MFLDAARKRAAELDVRHHVTFIQGDAGEYSHVAHEVDVVSCIGAIWNGSGLGGTVELMKPALYPGV